MPQAVVNLPRIAVLLATYNGEPFVDCQIHSLLSQQNVSVHIFARDDGSTDNTVSQLKAFTISHPLRVTLIADAQGRTGSAATNFFALLKGVDFADFDYVALSDQDDIWLPTKLQQAIECIRINGGGGYSSNLLAWSDEIDASWILDKGGQPKSLDYLFQGASAGCTYVLDRASATCVQRRLNELVHPYCDGISHDWVLYAICRSAGFPWFFDTQFYIRYRQHSQNVYGAMSGMEGMIARLKIMQAGWYKTHILWLGNVIENHSEETAILAAVGRGSLSDRFMLIWNSFCFRRKVSDVWKLRIAFVIGLL